MNDPTSPIDQLEAIADLFPVQLLVMREYVEKLREMGDSEDSPA